MIRLQHHFSLFNPSRFEALVDAPHTNENNTIIGYHIPVGNITYDRTLFDDGGKMDIASGIYSAPKDGIYLYGIDGHKCSGNALAEIQVYHNGVLKKIISHSDATPQGTQLTSFWSLEMKAGDLVYLTNIQQNSLYTFGSPASYKFSFIGFLLS